MKTASPDALTYTALAVAAFAFVGIIVATAVILSTLNLRVEPDGRQIASWGVSGQLELSRVHHELAVHLTIGAEKNRDLLEGRRRGCAIVRVRDVIRSPRTTATRMRLG